MIGRGCVCIPKKAQKQSPVRTSMIRRPASSTSKSFDRTQFKKTLQYIGHAHVQSIKIKQFHGKDQHRRARFHDSVTLFLHFLSFRSIYIARYVFFVSICRPGDCLQTVLIVVLARVWCRTFARMKEKQTNWAADRRSFPPQKREKEGEGPVCFYVI